MAGHQRVLAQRGHHIPAPHRPARLGEHRKQLIRENRVDGLASPSATAVRGDRLYITDGGVAEPHDAKLQIGRINVAALFVGAAH